ncbi:MAG: poly(3-hydroxyalkanoate) depolymerase [Burkholderiales bacterium]|nr:poly(3-hydroxyalkanoate) depolymerase [Burkholderiales bacterium]MBS0402285.1 poly(3-hydroxyalkanoate) depolymerase [Pseudomonadota bacterium]MBS0415214.1 poly(3-hydroxyalkanoate) depolymerase [Pseudomonadota bacterium]HMN56215.1 poly(3-hydroxyalkanoate) depolymerase [Ottowia sp.]
MDSPDTATANRAEPRFERRTVDGHELRIAVWAGTSADKPPLLLFNGIGSRIELMAPFVDHLDPEREIIALDVPGTGESPATPFPYRLWMMARLVGHLLEQLKVERVDALGVSWGGTLAQQFALQNPRRCRRLVLAATAAGGLLIPGDLRVLAKMTTPRRFKDPNFMRDNLGALYGGVARTDPEALTDFARLSRSPSRRGYLYQQMALAGWISAPLLPLLRQPTLIMAGNDDPIVPLVNARIMARLIPHSTLVELDDGHLFLFTKATESAAAVDRFLDSGEK